MLLNHKLEPLALALYRTALPSSSSSVPSLRFFLLCSIGEKIFFAVLVAKENKHLHTYSRPDSRATYTVGERTDVDAGRLRQFSQKIM